MQPKFIAAALSLLMGLSLSGQSLAAGETPSKQNKRPANATRQLASEDLLARTVFQSLIGEFALRRGDMKLALEAWGDLAQRTRDPKVIARAAEIAGAARQYDQALALTKLWLEVEPDSAKAQQMESSLLIMSNRIEDLAPQLATVLEQDKGNIAANLLQLNRILAKHTDKKAVQKLVDRLASPYKYLPEAHFAMAQAAAHAGDDVRALNEAEQALLLRPDWEAAALIRAQLQARQSNLTAIDHLSRFVDNNPGAQDARLTLARLLISEKQYNDSRKQFDRLLKDAPDSPDIIYPAAMLALQQGDTQTGRRLLEKLLTTDFPDKSSIHFFLGQLDQEEKKPDAALEHYRKVTAGEQFVAARGRAAQILQQQGKAEEARKLLQTTRGSNDAEQTQLILAESQLLRESGRQNDAYIVLETALSSQPDNLELLYETALTAERIGKPELLESHLKHLLKLKPDHAHALNAMGYSFAERNIRLDEAHALITKALTLLPDDPFITDSLGWVLFRQGKLNESLLVLQKAYSAKADPEIAAHLGEVLWQLNRKDEARKILLESAKQNPENEVLSGVIKKLQP
jgi:tetratricopeptide (TPR) repeat protein